MLRDPACDPDGAGGSADIVVLLQLVGEKGDFRQAGSVFQRYKTHDLIVTGFRPAGRGDKARYRDFSIDKPVQLGGRDVSDAEQYGRVDIEGNSRNFHLGF